MIDSFCVTNRARNIRFGHRFLANYIHIDRIISRRERFAKGNFHVYRVFLQGKMLISDRRCSSDIIHRQHYEGQIKVPPAVVGYS